MGYSYWPGAYSFQEQLGLFLAFMKEQIEFLLEKIDKACEWAE